MLNGQWMTINSKSNFKPCQTCWYDIDYSIPKIKIGNVQPYEMNLKIKVSPTIDLDFMNLRCAFVASKI